MEAYLKGYITVSLNSICSATVYRDAGLDAIPGLRSRVLGDPRAPCRGPQGHPQAHGALSQPGDLHQRRASRVLTAMDHAPVAFGEVVDRLRTAYSLAEVSLADLEADVHGIHDRLRQDSPVAICAELEALFVVRWADVTTVVSNSELFRSDQPDSFLTRFVGPNMLHSEGLEHRVVRALVLPAFRAAGSWLRDEAARMYAGLRDSRPAGSPCDLVAEYCVPLVARATIGLLGCEEAVTPDQMARWSPALSKGAFNFHGDSAIDEDAKEARDEILEVVASYASGRRRARKNTILDCLAVQPGSPDDVSKIVEFMITGADAGPRGASAPSWPARSSPSQEPAPCSRTRPRRARPSPTRPSGGSRRSGPSPARPGPTPRCPASR